MRDSLQCTPVNKLQYKEQKWELLSLDGGSEFFLEKYVMQSKTTVTKYIKNNLGKRRTSYKSS